jgi:hypothetical protein
MLLLNFDDKNTFASLFVFSQFVAVAARTLYSNTGVDAIVVTRIAYRASAVKDFKSIAQSPILIYLSPFLSALFSGLHETPSLIKM